MRKTKLQKFKEIEKFSNVFQCPYTILKKKIKIKNKLSNLFPQNDNPLILELGCGKGEYTTNLARLFPNKNFVGVDIKGARIYSGAKQALMENLNNVAFLRTNIDIINHFFIQNKISEIWIPFPDPQIKKINKRLISARFIKYYSNILINNGIIHLKTDSDFLFNYTRKIIEANNFRILFQTNDLYKNYQTDRILTIKTFYEQQWLNKGLKIKYISFFLQKKEIYFEPKSGINI
ncbi:MAG: tRNA (guanosine(46)-N7)-methyltransferase TrmB [Bacteroidales bacterium OttesenSCG-928-I14]|jgi:tRNA (guanine-N7-)-methyltransferase|nr:tRNA (guanosine(46)-N7)-methyltransferase TrmB [Bacteroidales bacterium OttesenSCG-928-I14]